MSAERRVLIDSSDKVAICGTAFRDDKWKRPPIDAIALFSHHSFFSEKRQAGSLAKKTSKKLFSYLKVCPKVYSLDMGCSTEKLRLICP